MHSDAGKRSKAFLNFTNKQQFEASHISYIRYNNSDVYYLYMFR